MQRARIPQVAPATTPIEREEELLRKFAEASRAFYLLADRQGAWERRQRVGELMDALGAELRS